MAKARLKGQYRALSAEIRKERLKMIDKSQEIR